MKRRFRLTSSTDFMRVRRQGKSYAHPLVVLVTARNEMETSRFAVSAGRSVGNAVQRNRAKRLLREALRPLISEILCGWDILLLARRGAAEATLQQIESALAQLLSRSRLLIELHDERDTRGI